MKPQNNIDTSIKMISMLCEEPPTFGCRLRQIRKERGLTQEEFGTILGLSKQQISQYETENRAPRTIRIQEIARRLNMSIGDLLGSKSAAEAIEADFWKAKGKPFYQIFEDIVYVHLGLSAEEVALFTGLGEEIIQQIVSRRIEVPPLEVAMILESTLNVPIDVWAGRSEYTPADISVYGFQLARAYMQLDDYYKAIVSTVLRHNNA